MMVDPVVGRVYRIGQTPVLHGSAPQMKKPCRMPWYWVQHPEPNPPPIAGLFRPWIIDKLANGRGCPGVARCGVPGRDGEGCAQPGFRRDPPDVARAEAVQQQREATGHAGVVGVSYFGEDERMRRAYLEPQEMRKYALQWGKDWDALTSRKEYQIYPGNPDDITCENPADFINYAKGYAHDRGRFDLNDADRRVRLTPIASTNKYLAAVETCMQAGSDWRECALRGDLLALRNQAEDQGVPWWLLDVELGYLGKPMDEQALRHGILAACQVHTNSQSSICSSTANVVADAAIKNASWLLTSSGQALQENMYQAIHGRGMFPRGGDPQLMAVRSIRTLQSLWKRSLLALQAAWDQARAQAGLAPKDADFATPLKQYLLKNGWGTANSNPWEHGGMKVWLIGTNKDPMSIDPGSANHTTWPWAAGFQGWQQNQCGPSCQSNAFKGLLTLYAMLRIDPLQQALKQGLRDIAVMVSDEAIVHSSGSR